MMVSTKGRYALRVMIDLAEHQAEGYIPLKAIARRQDISEKYLESILKSLVQSQFLTGVRGKGGGYPADKARPSSIPWEAFCGLRGQPGPRGLPGTGAGGMSAQGPNAARCPCGGS